MVSLSSEASHPHSFQKVFTVEPVDWGEGSRHLPILTITLLCGAWVPTQWPELQLSSNGSQPIIFRDAGTSVLIFLTIDLSVQWNSKWKICEILLEPYSQLGTMLLCPRTLAESETLWLSWLGGYNRHLEDNTQRTNEQGCHWEQAPSGGFWGILEQKESSTAIPPHQKASPMAPAYSQSKGSMSQIWRSFKVSPNYIYDLIRSKVLKSLHDPKDSKSLNHKKTEGNA
jgi:hypothetical protein